MRKFNRCSLVTLLGIFALWSTACGPPLIGEWAGSGSGTLTNTNGVFNINITSVTYNFKDDDNYTHTQNHTVHTPISQDFTIESEGSYTYTGTDGGTITVKPTSHKTNGTAQTTLSSATMTYSIDDDLKLAWTHRDKGDTVNVSATLSRQ